eukprot:4132384-Pleurochrysis_carterae.AAC.1
MKGAGFTSAVGSGSPRRWWNRPCIQEGGPTHTPRTCSISPQSFRKAAVSALCARVRWMRCTALRALSRRRKSTPAPVTKTTPNQKTELPISRFSGMAMVRPRLRVTLCQARRSATM